MRMHPNREMGTGPFEVEQCCRQSLWTGTDVRHRRPRLGDISDAADSDAARDHPAAEHDHSFGWKKLPPSRDHQVRRNDDSIACCSQFTISFVALDCLEV